MHPILPPGSWLLLLMPGTPYSASNARCKRSDSVKYVKLSTRSASWSNNLVVMRLILIATRSRRESAEDEAGLRDMTAEARMSAEHITTMNALHI